ncbi:MAG: glycogen/starch synthase, partial [Spirochaetia bacterium]|nr:glycogen/starch synthase [Spirochaetia bacterium]
MLESELPKFDRPDWTAPPLILEVGWEVCQQLGGIYTVLRSKAPSMVHHYDADYCLLGPYNANTAPIEFEERTAEKTPFATAAAALRTLGIDAKCGQWLVPGRPKAVLIDIEAARAKLGEIKYFLWEKHGVHTGVDDLVDNVLMFGDMVVRFVASLVTAAGGRPVVAHFHEWMGGTALPEIRRLKIPVTTVFTTHATILGRYIATADPNFYANLPRVNAFEEAKRFDIESKFQLERAAAHGAHVFTTLSTPTAMECRHLIGREPDLLVPNGIHLERPVAIHEYENLHQKYKENINRFVMGYFFPSYTFNLDNTLYFFTSGRYEYRNKGFDLTVEALARLNHRLRTEKVDKTVVAFFITRRPFRNIHPEILSSMALLQELKRTCEGIKEQIGERLFLDVAGGK